MPDQPTSITSGGGYNSNNGFSGGNGVGVGNNGNRMNNMQGNMPQMQGNNKMGSGRGKEEFTIEEYQASLQQFLSHNDTVGGGSSRENSQIQPDHMMSREKMAQQAGNLTNSSSSARNNNPYNITGAGAIQCIQVPTNFDDDKGGGGGNKRSNPPRSSLRSVDDMDLPIGRNTFQSVDSNNRPSFQSSMDDMDIRGTFKSVDTMDLMSIGNSINEIMDDDIKQNPEMRKKYGRRMSNAASRSGMSKGAGGGGGGGNNAASLNNFRHLPGQTLEIKTMDHGQGGRSSGRGGGKKKTRKDGGDSQLAPTGTRHSVQTKGCDGPSTAGMGGRNSQLSIQNLMDGADDASRMSFGNMSVMSELTDFQEMLARGHGDSFNQL